MLITKQQVEQAMSLDIASVVEALCRTSKVAPGEITGIEFSGMTSDGQFAYIVYGPSPEEGDDDCCLGTVYLRYQRLPMSKDFVLISEY